MRTAWMLFGLSLLPAVAAAQPAVEILSPGAGTCVANQVALFTGGIAGGEAAVDPSNVIVRARLTNHNGALLSVTLMIDGEPARVTFHQPPNANPEDVDFTFDAFQVIDGANRRLGLMVAPEAGGPGGSDEVTVRIDRRPPRVDFDLDALAEAQNGDCFPAPPNVPYQVVDEQDQNPVSAVRNETNGCEVSRIIRATDNCGNGAEYVFTTRRAPTPGQVTVALNGFRCGLMSCVTDGPDARPFQNGDRVGRGTVLFDVEGDLNCIGAFDTEFTIDGQDAGVFQFDSPLESPGAYRVALTVGACGADIDSDAIQFTILDRPNADAGGPYQVAQGAPLMLDASRSTAAPELGGIVEYAWDVDGDGLYDQIAEMRGNQWFDQITNQPLANPARAPFDSTVGDGEYAVQVRITAGNGGVEFGNGTVTVTDVSPTCVVTGPAAGVEGDAITFVGVNSAPGHPSDPIISYGWEFGDGVGGQNAAGLTEAAHIYGGGGVYTVTLTVHDVDSSTSCTTEINIEGVGPVVAGVAAFNADLLLEGVEVGFTAGDTRPGSAFTPLQSFNWTFGLPGANQSGEGLRNPRFTYNDDGNYEVCLEVVDVEGASDRECINIEVADLSPIAELSGDRFGSEGEILTFEAEARGSPADPLVAVIWDFGDGTIERTEPPVFRMDHIFDGSGEFTVTVTAVDEDSETVSDPVEVVIEDVVPEVDARVVYEEGRLNGTEGEPITFDASGSEAGSELDPIVLYTFDFGDGTVLESEEPIVEHSYPDEGVFEVRVSVTDSDGSTVGTTLVAVTINRPPTVQIEVVNPQAEIGEEVELRAIVDDVEADLPLPKVRWTLGDGTIINNGETTIRHAYQAVGEFHVRVDVDDYDGSCVLAQGLPPGACGDPDQPAACECPGLRTNICDQRPECRLIGGDASAEADVEVTPAAPRIAQAGPFTVTEGELLEFRLQVDAAPRDDDGMGNAQFDGPTVIGVPSIPPGARFAITPNGDAAQSQFLNFTWQPSFFDAGEYTIRVTALGPFSGIDRTRDIRITVLEGGTPFLVGAGGRANRGVVTVYEYTRDRAGDTALTARAQVEVGAGTGGLAVSSADGRVYVAVPGSGGVSVVDVRGAPRFLRRVPTGNGTASVAWSPGHVWAVNALDNTLTAIDTETLKVVETIDPGVGRPIDLVWLGDGFGGASGHLAVIGSRSGEVALVDPDRVLAGMDGAVATHRIGGVLTRIVADPSTGMLHIADGKTRRVYHLSAASILDGARPTSTNVTFGARDLLASDGQLWIATDGGLITVDDGGAADTDTTIVAKALTTVSNEIIEGSGVAAAVGDRVENYDADLARLSGAAGSRIRRLAAFVAHQ